MLIEQAIFTSTCSDRTAGYQLVARSRGISDSDARELTVWGPSHDSLADDGNDHQSVNFHRLPSGTHCVSRTVLAGQEYSHRRGDLVHTHCLLADDEAMQRFANNPFNLLRAATALGVLTNTPPTDSRLEPFRLVGRSAPFDADALRLAAAALPEHAVARVIEAVATHESVGICAVADFRALVMAVLQCLPLVCRAELSFATGLKPSVQRPYRLIYLGSPEDSVKRHASRRFGLEVVELDRPAEGPLRHGWARYVDHILASNDWTHLERCVAGGGTRRLTDLDQAGRDLLDDAANSPQESDQADDLASGVVNFATPDRTTGQRAERSEAKRRAIARWVAPAGADSFVTDMITDPAQVIGRKCPDVREELEQLDDMVFEAIAGKRSAIESLRTLWPQLATNLPQDMLDESRFQYLRHAISLWRDCVDAEEFRLPGQAVAALDVVDVLFEQDLHHAPD
ncbi:MAG: hypothetical protein KDA63_00455 [Planctomycetales bacterium]|nr:hypothetical protein [Planctomycetales bacterium]